MIKANFTKIYDYDIIIPKYHKAEEVSIINNNMLKFTSKLFNFGQKPSKPHKDDEFEEVMKELDQKDPNLSPDGLKK